jgi:hypothetical protein
MPCSGLGAARDGPARRQARTTCENRVMGYFAALSIAVLAIVGCVLMFRKRRSGL